MFGGGSLGVGEMNHAGIIFYVVFIMCVLWFALRRPTKRAERERREMKRAAVRESAEK